MLQTILKTDRDITTFILRVILAAVVLPHGLQKLIGVFGGYGFDGTMDYFTGTVGLPWTLGLIVILIESIGMVLLAVGFLTRPIVLLLIIVMIGAASMHFQNGFFMNWFNNQPGEGVEFFIVVCALSLNMAIRGGGRFSLDHHFG